MLRPLKIISESEYNYLMNNTMAVYEKLDMFYFNVIITHYTATVLKSNHHIIDKIDRIMNSTYSDIVEFVNTSIYPKLDTIFKKYGECIVGFFYCPVEKPISINYKTSPLLHRFILGNIKSLVDGHKIDENPADAELFSSENYKVLPYPIIETDSDYKNLLDLYIYNKMNSKDFIKEICKNSTYSKLDPDEIEGIIIKNNKYSFQVLNHESKAEYESKIKYYDEFLKDFINWYVLSNISIDISKDYVDSVSDIFIEYANGSDFLKNYKYDPSFLSPSINSYIGDLDYNLINNKTVGIICKYNELYKNVYRILIHNLRYKKSPRDSKYLKENDFYLWNELVDKINQSF